MGFLALHTLFEVCAPLINTKKINMNSMHETDSKETSVDKAVVSKVIVWKCDHTLRSVQSIQLSLSSLRLCILYTVQRTFSFRCRHNTLTKAMTFRFLVRIVYYL